MDELIRGGRLPAQAKFPPISTPRQTVYRPLLRHRHVGYFFATEYSEELASCRTSAHRRRTTRWTRRQAGGAGVDCGLPERSASLSSSGGRHERVEDCSATGYPETAKSRLRYAICSLRQGMRELR